MPINLDFKNYKEPMKGSLLISNPMLADRLFQRSVILICEHNEKGTLGFVINKQSQTNVSESHIDLDQLPLKLHYGGPVDMNGVNMVHRNINIEDKKHIIKDLYYSGKMSDIPSLYNTMRLPLNDIKFFLGYSSWVPNQLNYEINKNTWIVLNNYDTEFIFNTEYTSMWSAALSLMGNKYKAFINFPVNPAFN